MWRHRHLSQSSAPGSHVGTGTQTRVCSSRSSNRNGRCPSEHRALARRKALPGLAEDLRREQSPGHEKERRLDHEHRDHGESRGQRRVAQQGWWVRRAKKYNDRRVSNLQVECNIDKLVQPLVGDGKEVEGRLQRVAPFI